MRLASAAILLAGSAVAWAQETGGLWLELESGSRLRVEWATPELVVADGERRTTIEPGRITRVVPGVWYDEATIARVEALAGDLGSDDYLTRQDATESLPAYGWLAASRLEPLRTSSDPEIAARAAAILERIEQGEGRDHPAPRPDRVETAEGALEGRLQPGNATFGWRGAELSVTWDEVASLSATPEDRVAPEPPPAAFRRLEPDDFRDSDRRIDFDVDAAGVPIPQGSDVELAWADLGAVFDSEIEASVVCADAFVVSGKSRGNSGANRDPRWQGHVNLYLFQPGTLDRASRRGLPAGVHRVGVYVADVSPNGTGLRAWSADGRALHEVRTDGSSTDFLGLESPVPIHRVEVFDDPTIDSNFTTDDFVFGPIVAPGADRDRFVFALADGERLVVPAFSTGAGGLRLAATPGATDVEIRWPEISSAHAPTARLDWSREGGVRWFGPGDGVVSLTAEGVVVEQGGGRETLGWDAVAAVRFRKE